MAYGIGTVSVGAYFGVDTGGLRHNSKGLACSDKWNNLTRAQRKMIQRIKKWQKHSRAARTGLKAADLLGKGGCSVNAGLEQELPKCRTGFAGSLALDVHGEVGIGIIVEGTWRAGTCDFEKGCRLELKLKDVSGSVKLGLRAVAKIGGRATANFGFELYN